ncbi:hypothetical protein WJX82_002934 [Trebouxia sp. C0006]
MPESCSKPVPIPRASDGRCWSNEGREQIPQERRSVQQDTYVQRERNPVNRVPRSRLSEDIELGMAEIQRIMQGDSNNKQGHAKSVQCFCGVSPPTRSSGAANPLGLDTAWRNTAYKACTHSNLQALREMSESAILHSNVYGDVFSIPDSPELGFLSAEFDGFDEMDERRTSPASDQTHY